MNPKAIILDLDGTLLKNDKSITDYTVDILNQYSKIGKIIVATGRSIYRITKYSSRFETAGIVANNGGAIYQGDQKIKQYDINSETLKELVHKLIELEDCELSVWYPTTNLTTNPVYARPNGPTYYSDFQDFDTNEIQKISIVTKHHDAIDAIDYHYYGCRLLRNTHEPDFFVLMNEEVSKKSGLIYLLSALNIDPKDAIAFGDDFNDLDMFSICGKSVAVANSSEVVKEAADEVCLSNEEDGVAHWIEENLLK